MFGLNLRKNFKFVFRLKKFDLDLCDWDFFSFLDVDDIESNGIKVFFDVIIYRFRVLKMVNDLKGLFELLKSFFF